MTELLLEGTTDFSKPQDPDYLRRQKRPEARKSPRRWSLAGRARAIFLGVFLLSAAALAVWSAMYFARGDARFRLASLHLRGGKFVAQSQIEEKFLLDRGKSILEVPLVQRRSEIEQIPWVRSATVARVFPNQLWVTVRERVPVAFLRTSLGISLIDEEGVILDSPLEASFTFPVVQGISEQDPAGERRSKMQLFIALMQDLERGDQRLSEEISEVDLTDPQDARVVVADAAGAVLLHLGKENFLSRYLIYAGHIAQWKQKFANIQSIDLRYDGQAVMNADPQRSVQLPKAGSPSPAKSSRPAAPAAPGPTQEPGRGQPTP